MASESATSSGTFDWGIAVSMSERMSSGGIRLRKLITRIAPSITRMPAA